MALTTRVITWDFVDCGLDAQRGSVTAAPSQTLTDPADKVIATTAGKTWDYRGGSGQSTPLIDTGNAAIQQQGWWYNFTIQQGLQPPWTFPAFLPPGSVPIDLTALSPLVSPAVMAAYLLATGGSLTGPLLLARDPQASLEAATKEYVDAAVADAVAAIAAEQARAMATEALLLPLAGGTVTGDLTIG
jgi:hypothetical protein